MNPISFVFGIITALSLGCLFGMAINERLNKHHNERIERIQKRFEEDRWRTRVNVDLRIIKERLGIPVKDEE